MQIFLFILLLPHIASEEVLILLIWKVLVIISVRVLVNSGVVAIIIPIGVRSHKRSLSQYLRHRTKLVYISSKVVSGYFHCSFVCFIVDF